jgi:hypothetical protein
MLATGNGRNKETPAEIPLADRRCRSAVAPARRWPLLSQKNRRLRRSEQGLALSPNSEVGLQLFQAKRNRC